MGNRQAFWLARDISLTVAAQPRTCTDVSLRCYGLQACVVILSHRLRIGNAGEGGNFTTFSFKARDLEVVALLNAEEALYKALHAHLTDCSRKNTISKANSVN